METPEPKGQSQTRDVKTYLERRLITENILIDLEHSELSYSTREELGYDGLLFKTHTLKEVVATLDNPAYLLTRSLSGSGGVFDTDSVGAQLVFGEITSDIREYFAKEHGNQMLGLLVFERTIKYEPFEIPINLPNPTQNWQICTGMAVADVNGHAFYRK